MNSASISCHSFPHLGKETRHNLSQVLASVAGFTQTYADLYDLGTGGNDPANPDGFLVQGRDGALYGTSTQGGKLGLGAIYKISTGGKLQLLYSFDGTLGTCHSGLTLASDGNLYGTTDGPDSGGPPFGTVFRITPDGNFSVLHTFVDTGDAGYPHAPPIEGIDHYFYGTTGRGGNRGYGTVYKMTAAGQLVTLHEFDNTHGAFPSAPLMQARSGNIYGVTTGGGTSGNGTIFKVTPKGKFTVLYNFDVTHGAQPFAPLIQGSDDNFYGTTVRSNKHGIAFKMTPKGDLFILHDFKLREGKGIYAGLVQATDGRFYGSSTQGGSNGLGTLFKVNRVGGFSVVYNFDDAGGAQGLTTLIQHTSGGVYSTTFEGGAFGQGSFYNLDLGLGPFVSMDAKARHAGQDVGILGQGLTGTTDVSFNGTPAGFTVVTDTFLTATVPPGATSGSVTVTTPGGKLSSNVIFRVVP